MVERRPLLDLLSHVVMVLAVLIVAFPIYLAFVASTHTAQDIVQAPMPLLPGSHGWDNYVNALTGHGGGKGSNAPVARMHPGQAAQQDQTVGAAAGVLTGVKHGHSHDQGERHHHQSQNGEGVEDRHGTAAGPAGQLVDSPMGVSAPLGPLP